MMDHDRGDHQTRAHTGTTRRRLLGAASGSFALAASGLFIPQWLEEAAARPGAASGALGGRHGRDHKGRHRRRTHGDEKDKGKHGNDAPGALIDGINWGYLSSAGAFDVEFWVVLDNKDWAPLDSRRVPDRHRDAFVTKRTTGILWINRRYFLKAKNYYGQLLVTVGYGGSVTGADGWVGGKKVFDDGLRVGDQADMAVDGFKFAVRRSNDDDDYKYPFLDLYK